MPFVSRDLLSRCHGSDSLPAYGAAPLLSISGVSCGLASVAEGAPVASGGIQQQQQQHGSHASCMRIYGKKYVLLCGVCGGLAILLGALFVGICFILRNFTSSLHYFETIPTYVPAVVLILTGLLILSFVKRSNRYAYLLKLSGAFCLVSSVLCVVVTITTTVIHMNRLQTLKECVHSQQSRTCTCYAGVSDSGTDGEEALARYVFTDTSDCEVIHGVLYSCLRALFGLSVLGILICIFSAMLVYQLLSHEKKKLYWEQLEVRRRAFCRQNPQFSYLGCYGHPQQWELVDDCFWPGHGCGLADNPEDFGCSPLEQQQHHQHHQQQRPAAADLWPWTGDRRCSDDGFRHGSPIPFLCARHQGGRASAGASEYLPTGAPLSSSGYERPFHEYASIPMGPPPPYSRPNSVENLLAAATAANELFLAPAKGAPSPSPAGRTGSSSSPASLQNASCPPPAPRACYPSRTSASSLPSRRRKRGTFAPGRRTHQLSALSLQDVNEMLLGFQRVRELQRSLLTEQNALRQLIRSMRRERPSDERPPSPIDSHESEIYFADESSLDAGRLSPGPVSGSRGPEEDEEGDDDEEEEEEGGENVYTELCLDPGTPPPAADQKQANSLPNISSNLGLTAGGIRAASGRPRRFLPGCRLRKPADLPRKRDAGSLLLHGMNSPRSRTNIRLGDWERMFLPSADLHRAVVLRKGFRKTSWNQLAFLNSLMDTAYFQTLSKPKSEPSSPIKCGGVARSNTPASINV